MTERPEKPPQPVKVANPEPIEVTPIADPEAPPLPVEIHETPDSDAQTTAKVVKEKARTDARVLQTEDQRRISGIWERTQQIIALSVVLTSLAVSAWLTVTTEEGASTSFVFLASVANLVIGFYFGRTNHQKVGGDVSSGGEGQVGR